MRTVGKQRSVISSLYFLYPLGDCIPEPDVAFSIVCCFGFLTSGERSPTLWIKSKASCSLRLPTTGWQLPVWINHGPPQANPVHPPSLQNHHQNLSAQQLVSSTHQLQSHMCAASLLLPPSLLADHSSSILVSWFRFLPYHQVPCK
ncbi:hypothetical protein ATANTOWER_012308 [Ataeniobius toweri]|uniref:Uncharacterized protein n=1 Tax=Ataeniobius toweri TaxID=208326 RepID=A0ABU7AU48_9TELE|nr:hypothetical protein [Ataeniobius toweri]